VSSGDRAKVLFYANAVPASNCSGTATADVQILEPKPGREESEEYVRAVAAMGFVPTLVRNILADQKIRLEQQRVERELPQLTTRGTRVCRTEGRLTYVGFVDDVTPDRSKVRIEVKGTTNGFRPGGWQPGPIWAPPASWRVCE
jgi:hypothetical protein